MWQTHWYRRLVIDTNLIIAARWNRRSTSRRILEAVAEGRATLIWSEAVRREALFVLGQVHPPADFRGFVESLFRQEHRVDDPPAVSQSEDPDDDKFLAAAIGGAVDVVISNDRHLLDVKWIEGIPILRPREAIRRIDPRGQAEEG